MNRPKFEDYEHGTISISTRYVFDLEKYCEMYKKAFERACYELAYSNKQLRDLDKGFVKMTEVDWKEYILKNV